MREPGQLDKLRELLTDRRTLRAEVMRLRAAIARHKRRCVIDPQPWDRDLWAALDA